MTTLVDTLCADQHMFSPKTNFENQIFTKWHQFDCFDEKVTKNQKYLMGSNILNNFNLKKIDDVINGRPLLSKKYILTLT